MNKLYAIWSILTHKNYFVLVETKDYSETFSQVEEGTGDYVSAVREYTGLLQEFEQDDIPYLGNHVN